MVDSVKLVPRLATKEDLPRLRVIVDSAYGKYLPRMDRPPGPMLRDLAPGVEGGNCWVLGRPVFGLIFLVPTDDGLFIENVAIHPDAQGQGFGRQLLEFAEDHARRLGIGRMRLHTNEVMTENLAIYAHLGYRESGRRTDGGYRHVLMEKSLCPESAL